MTFSAQIRTNWPTAVMTAALAAIIVCASGASAIAQGIGVGDGDAVDIVHMVEVGLLPSIAAIVVSIIGGLLIIGARKFDTLTGLRIEDTVRSIEEKHRDALQSAVLNAAGAALAKYGPSVVIDPSTDAGKFVIGAVKLAVPEAVNALGAADQWITNTANAKLALNVPAAPVVNIAPALASEAPVAAPGVTAGLGS